MAPAARPIIVQGSGGGGAAGILLILVAIVGLIALFSGNLDELIQRLAGAKGGPEGIFKQGAGSAAPVPGAGPAGEPATRVPTPVPDPIVGPI